MKVARPLLAAVAFVVAALATPSASAGTGPGANGPIAYLDGGVISAVDPASGGVTPLVDGFDYVADLNYSADGSKLVFSGTPAGDVDTSLFIVNANGSGLTAIATPGVTSVQGPDLSPDGSAIAFQGIAGGIDLFRIDLATGVITRITNDGNVEGPPAWSPDGTRLAFERTLNPFGGPFGPPNNIDIYTSDPDGANMVRLTTDESTEYGPTWSPSGTQIAFVRISSADEDVWAMNADGTGQVNLTNAPASLEQLPAYSPDGSNIVYTKSSATTTRLAIRPADGSGSETVLRVQGYSPSWGIRQPAGSVGTVSGSGAIVPGGPTSDPGDVLPGANGRAKGSFSVNARYRAGQTTPSGSVKFDMDGGVFSLRSQSVASLELVSASTADVAGVASIRGRTGTFPFVVTVVDGAEDRFRLRVWAPGDDVDADPVLYQASGRVSGQVRVTT